MTRFQKRGELTGWFRGAVIFGTLAGLVALEFRRALRRQTREPKLRRDLRNIVVATAAGLAMQYAERPLTQRLARKVERRGWGIAPRLAGGDFVQTVAAVLLLDYGLYLWHVLTHKVPFLWRFHLVHHIDLDMDASTALRFHFGEMLLSVPWRLMQIVAAGASPFALSVWQTLLFVSILFHHSNVELPISIERWLGLVIMTPRLHGIHHEANREHSNSNWSSGLALWDLLHGTRLWNTSDADTNREAATRGGEDTTVTIGVPAYQRIEDVKLKECLTIPFLRQRNDWFPA